MGLLADGNLGEKKCLRFTVEPIVVTRSLGLAKLPLYSRNVVIRRQQNKETQSGNEIQDFKTSVQ